MLTFFMWAIGVSYNVSKDFELKAKADAGPTNDNIENLKKQVAANKDDTTSLYNLALAYQDANNWNGAAYAWQKMNTMLPTWEPAYYNKAYAFQQLGMNDMAVNAFQKYTEVALSKTPAEQEALKENIFGAYYSIALLLRATDKPKALENLTKAMALNPTDKNALLLQKELNKKNKYKLLDISRSFFL